MKQEAKKNRIKRIWKGYTTNRITAKTFLLLLNKYEPINMIEAHKLTFGE